MEYYAKFIGYVAQIVTKKEALHGVIDFASGGAQLFANGCHVSVRKCSDLAAFVSRLSMRLDEIIREIALKKGNPATGHIVLRFGDDELTLKPGTDPSKAISRLMVRLRHIGTIIPQVEVIGSQIDRRPYSEHIKEIEETGFATVEWRGVASFKDGKLHAFHPLYVAGQFKPNEKVVANVPSYIKLGQSGAAASQS